MKKISAVA